MAVLYKVAKKHNPRNLKDVKYFAVTKARSTVNLEDLAEMVSMQTSMTKGDCYGVLIALQDNIINELENGRIVALGGMGTYRISMSSKGVEKKEDFKTKNIEKARILFRPGKEFRRMLKSLKYQKVK